MLSNYNTAESVALARFAHPDAFIVIGYTVDGDTLMCVQHYDESGRIGSFVMMGSLALKSAPSLCAVCGERVEECEPLLTEDDVAIL